MAIFTIELPDTDPLTPGKQTDVNVTGILAGTTWSLNWGDGTTNTYTSVSDNDIPTDINFFTHIYTTASDCVYEVTLTTTNPCGKVNFVSYSIEVHGRDEGDNDGELIIEDVASGETAVIEVCEGSEHIITLRDISDWNCQDPTYPDGTPAPPNDDPRHIQWVYGEDDGGGIQNTIGTTLGTLAPVIIGGSNQATTANGYEQLPVIGPITATGEISQTILIPEDCRATEFFDVYLRNWNKCNPYPADPPVFTHIRILVVDAPDAPTVPDRTICFGEDRTLEVTSAPAGTFTWYSDAALSTNVGTGDIYIPTQTAPGVYTFWVTDQETSGLFCMSPATEVTLTIREEIERPGPITGTTGTCPNVNGLVYSVPAVTMTKPIGGAMEYVWSVGSGLTIFSGQGTRQITVNVGTTSGNKDINVFLRYTTDPRCNSNDRELTLAVYSTTHNAGTITGSGICPGSTVSITSTAAATTGTPASSGPTYSWERSTGPGFGTWTGLSGTGATFSEVLNTTGIYRYRRTATFGCGTPVSTTVDIPVYSTVHDPGSITSSDICRGQTVSIANAASASTGTPASSGPVYSWHRSVSPYTSWTPLTGSNANFSQTMNTPGVYRYRRTATFGCGTPVTTTVDVTVFSTTHVAGEIDGNDVCPGDLITINNITSASTGTPASSGPTYTWRRAPGPGFSAWTNLTGSGESYSETMATPGTYRYQRRATFGCGSTVSTTTDINVFSTTHNAGTISNTTACAGSSFTIASAAAASTGTPASSGPAYSWERAPGPAYTSWSARPGTGATITETIATPGIYRYRRTATFGCGSPVSTTADVTVYSTSHNAGAIGGLPICTGGTVSITNSTSASTGTPASSGPTYSWHRSVSPFSTWTPLTGSGATFSETMNTPGTYRYRRTATFGCGSPVTTTVDVVVNPLPDPVISGENNVCQFAEEIYSTPSIAGHSYSWSTTLGTIDGPSNGNTVTIDWNTVGTGSVTVTETIIATGCSRTTAAYSVVVNPGPPTVAPTYVSGLTNICRNGTLNLDVSNVATAIEYIWDFSWIPGTDNATSATSEISIDLTGLAPGTYTVTVAGSNGCGTGPWMTPPHSFNINDIPDLAPLGNTVCSDAASEITLSISNAGPTITGLTYTVASIEMNGLAASAGLPSSGSGLPSNVLVDDAYTNKTSANVNVIYSVVPVSSQGCTGNAENVTLIVQPEPVLANLSTSKCSDEALGFNLAVAAGSSPAASYNITSINANGLTASAGLPSSGSGLPASSIADDAWRNLSNAPVNVVYSIVPVGVNGCSGDTYTMTITVNPEPILATLNTTKCSDEPLGFSLAVATGSVPAANYNITSINANGLTSSAGLPSSGFGLPSSSIADDAWTNTTNAPVDVIYTVVPVSAAGCLGDPRTITIIVNPEPSLANLSNAVCSDSPSGITLAVAGTSVAAATYNITAINDGGLISSAGSPAVGNGLLAGVIADDAWTNKTSGDVNVVYTVVPVSASGCAGNPVDVTLTVRPEPVLANLDRSICSDAAFGFNLSLAPGSSPAASYNITAINSNGLTASAGLPSSGSGLPANVIADDAWTNTTNAPVNVVYSIVPVGVNGCSGDTYTMTIAINPEPVLASLNTTRCSDEALGFSLATAAGSVAASSYNITSINANGLTASAGLPSSGFGLPSNVIANDAWTNTTGAPVDVIYTVVPVSVAGCPGDPMTVTITVNPEPVLANLNTALCSDEALNFNLATASGSVAAASYNITSINANGLTASAGLPSSGSGLPASSIADDAWRNTTPLPVNVIYTIVPVSGSGCPGNPTAMIITVNPEPVMATPGTTVCSRESTGITLVVNAGGVAAASYNITSINSNGLTASAGLPSSGSGLPSSSIADDAWINITSASVNVVYTVVPVSAAGCEGNPSDITVAVKPEPVITPGQGTSACSNNPLNFEIALDNFTNPTAGVTFTWDAPALFPVNPSFTGGTARISASPANITDTFLNTLGLVGTATYTVTPYYNGCAGEPVDIVFLIGSEPVLDPDLNDFVCSNVPIGLILKEAAGSVTPSHYNIISVNYETGLNPGAGNALLPETTAPAGFLSGDVYSNLTGVNKTVTYRVQPVLAPDCFGDPVDVVITIGPQPVIVPGQTQFICSGVPINAEILLVPANTPAGTIFNWDAPFISDFTVQGTAGVFVDADPAGTIHITDAINNYGSAPITATYNIIPTSADGCIGDAVPVVITINQEPMPPAISGRDDLCVGDNPVVYTVAPVAGSSFHWTVDPAVGIKTFDFNTNAIMITAALTQGSGNITVYETNSLGCSGDPFTLPVQVWESPASEDITGDPVVCAYKTHVYSVTNRAGSTYSWTLPGGAAIIGNPSASSVTVLFGNVGGTIMVRETNVAGCVTDHNPFSVTVNPIPSANISNGGNMCDGGTRPLTVSFIGTAPFDITYAINGVVQPPVSTGDNPYIINATLAGTYSIVDITDGTGCTGTGSGTATITYFPKPTGIISGGGELCRGSSATITMTFTGVAPFTFTYSGGATPVTVTNHPNNVYTVNVSPLVTSTYTLTSLTDFNNCTGVLSGSATLNVNQPPSLSLTGANLICHNVPTGEIDMTITGGTAPFGISWTGPNGFTAPAEDISGLNEGYYAVTVTDSKGCSAIANITLSQPQPLNATVARTNVTCFGADNGTLTISGATGGYGTYGYSIDGGSSWQLAGNYTNLAPGTYVVIIRDEANPTCMMTLNPGLQITGPAQLTGTVSKTDITCFGATDGTITITNPAGGYGTYQYSHDGGSNWQDTPVFPGLSAGTYDVRIRDRAFPLCVEILNPAVVIIQPDALSASLQRTNISCFGANNGTITINGASGGYGTYEYSVNAGASWQTSNTFASLAPGPYNVRMRDRVNPACFIILNPALQLTQPDQLAGTVGSTNVTCNGANDGTITITNPLGGYGTYQYTIDGGTTWEDDGSFTNLSPGFYNVKIRDAANITCEITLRPVLQITEPAVLSASVASRAIACYGSNDGNITITNPMGGNGTYSYSIDGGATWQGSGTFDNLEPGTYDVRIADAANPACVIILNPALVITGPAVLSATVTPTMISCFGASNGIIAISDPAGGYGTYQYTIDGGANWRFTGNFTGLTPGTYDVRIRDAAHITCEVILDPALDITQPAILDADVASTNVTCFGGADGTITISNPTGGYGTYQYSINGGGAWQSSGSFTGLGQGTYNVQIRDAANPGCVIVLNNALVITQPSILRATINSTAIACYGSNDGIITITNPLGGSGTYEYSVGGVGSWQLAGTFNNLASGTYEVRIRDAANPLCEIVLNPGVIITEPGELGAIVATVNITCSGSDNGRIIISNPVGGYGTYDYSIDGGANWQLTGMFNNLTPGTYDVRIRDRANPTCFVILPAATITQTDPITADVGSTAIACYGSNDGTITITNPQGGTGAYSYTVNGGSSWQTSGSFTGLAPGTYNVRIRDAADITCEIVLDPALEITQPDKLSATVASANVTCYGANDGTITITNPQGGYGTYDYSIDGGANWQPGGNFLALAPGFYNVIVRDAAHPSCMVTLNGSLRITEPPVLSANVTSINISCNGADDGSITISGATGGYGTYVFSINGGTAWQASGLFENLTPGTYDVRIADAANPACVIILNPALVINEPDALSASLQKTDVTCFGANNGTISITAPSGGYGTYQYSINGTTWQGFGTFSNLAPATYEVSIRDAANPLCVVILDPALEITEPAVLEATINSTNVTCFGGNDGTITISGTTGGYGTYDYSINGGGSWNSTGVFTNLIAGAYNILIRDAAHPECIIVLNNAYIITQPAMLSATVSKTEVSCNGFDDGTITITSPSGGYGTYEYSNDGGLNWQSSGTFSNLAPGTYDVRMRDAANQACSAILYPNLLITEPLTLTLSSTGDVVLDCFGDNDGMGTFYAAGGTMPYTFIVDDNTTGGTEAAPGFNSQTFFNAGAGLVRVTVVDANGCSAQAVINLTQPDDLTPGSVEDNQVVCYGDNPATITQVTGPSGGPGSYVYQWQSSTNAAGPFVNIASNANLSEYTPPSGATYTQYYRRMVTSGTCMPVYSNVVEVLVNPRPVAFLTGGATICPGESSVIRVTMLSGTGPFTVNIANHGVVNNYYSGNDIIVTPAATTTYSLISVMDDNGCDVTEPSPNLSGTATVTVSDLPVITSFTPPPAICEFTLANFRVTATGTNLTYQWFVDEDGTGFNPVADGGTYFGAMTPTLQIFNTIRGMNGYVYHVDVTGCGTTVTSVDAVLTVNTGPEITLHPKDSTICLGQSAEFEADADGTDVTWQWYVNRGTGFGPVSDDSNFSGSQTATLAVTDAQASFNGWIFRAVASGVCGVPVNTNFAILRVINPSAVTIQPQPRAVCENSSTTFIANGTGYTALHWQVNTGAGWTDITDDATYLGANTQQLAIMNAPVSMNGYRFRLALYTICSTAYTSEAALTVNPNPVVDFSGINPVAACGGVPLVLDGNPVGGSGVWSQHRWTGDVGPLNSYTAQSPTFTTFITGTFNLNYRVTDSNGCTANDDLTVTVDYPSAQFTQDVEYGCTPLNVSFMKDMTGIAEWWWDFGDGSPLDSSNENPVHTFVNADPGSIGYYNVKLRVRSAGNCFAEYTSLVTVYPAIDASFTPSMDVICSGNSITFTALPGGTRYFWEYGDGVSGYATNVSSHLYLNLTTAPVVHTVRLTTTSFYNCVDTRTFDITVMPVPMPQFTADPVTQVFDPAGNPVQFTNETSDGTWNWLWKFGDNATSTEENPVHSYNDVGTYTVTLIASNAHCSDSVKHDVMVVPPAPVASFDPIPSGCSPLYVNINNTSLNTEVPGTTYHWDFGDGSVSTAKNPTYTYFTPGSYRIELVVTGPGGNSMYTQVVEAWPSPKAYFEISPPMVYVNDERVRAFNLSQGATSYLWDFGDGDTSKVKEPYHRYMDEGVYDITLWAYSANGCTDMYKLSPAVTVEPVGEIRFATVFTPNKTGPIDRSDLPSGGTEIDQFFYPPIRQKVLKYKLQIFNRLGVLIFESHDINIPWNGYYKGQLCQQGVYVWYVEGKYANGKPFKIVGNVTLLQ